MVAVAQLVEPRIVIPVVVGSSPISHPSASPFLFFPISVLTSEISRFLCACLLDYCVPITENFALVFLTSVVAARHLRRAVQGLEQGFPIKLMYKIDEDFHAGFC